MAYNKKVLVLLIAILLGAYALAELDTNDLDDMCNTNDNIFKRLSGTWQCDRPHYAEGFYHSYSDVITVGITDTDKYYNITDMAIQDIYGFINISSGEINTTKAGTYKINLQMAAQGTNTAQYELELFNGADAQNDCATFFTGQTNVHVSVTISCIKNLSVGDRLRVMVKDLNNPANNFQYHQLNFNIHEVT